VQPCDVCFVPKADILRCGKERNYSTTPSAMAISVGGIWRPSAFAVLRLKHLDVQTLLRYVNSTVAMLCHLRAPSLLMRARALATVREWKKRLERQAHSRSIGRGGCGLPVETGAMA